MDSIDKQIDEYRRTYPAIATYDVCGTFDDITAIEIAQLAASIVASVPHAHPAKEIAATAVSIAFDILARVHANLQAVESVRKLEAQAFVNGQ